MDNIIITITNQSKSFFYDIEVPIGLTISSLKDDIVEAINGYNPNLFLKAATVTLLCNRTGHILTDDDTMETAGVWNGDYITIKEV